MAYLGNVPAQSYTSYSKQDFTTSATTSYTLDYPVANENEIALFINFVRQEPTTAYTASGTSLTLTSATSASDDMYCVFLGKALQTVNPPAGSVGLSQLSATGTKDSTTFLRGDNTFSTLPNSGITEADQWRLYADFSMSTTGSAVLVNSNWERVDTDSFSQIGTGMTESSGIFSFPSTGIYFIQSIADIVNVSGAADTNPAGLRIYTTTDNSTYNFAAGSYQAAANGEYVTNVTSLIFNVTNISTHKVGFYYRCNRSLTLRGNTLFTESGVTFIRLGDSV